VLVDKTEKIVESGTALDLEEASRKRSISFENNVSADDSFKTEETLHAAIFRLNQLNVLINSMRAFCERGGVFQSQTGQTVGTWDTLTKIKTKKEKPNWRVVFGDIANQVSE